MKGSLTIVSFFFLGIILGVYKYVPNEFLENDYSMYVLYFLMFLVGISIGSDKHALKTIFTQNWKVVLVPFATIIGTFMGCIAITPLLSNLSIKDCLAVGSGFGYYSLSSIFISQYKGIEMGTIALTSNIMREILTLILTPILVTKWGKLAPISAGGATSMDTTLPIISKYTGKEYVPIAVFHGIAVDFSVPFLVTFFATL
jgi:Predicted membrane protein